MALHSKPAVCWLERALEERCGDEQRGNSEDEEEEQVELNRLKAAVFEELRNLALGRRQGSTTAMARSQAGKEATGYMAPEG